MKGLLAVLGTEKPWVRVTLGIMFGLCLGGLIPWYPAGPLACVFLGMLFASSYGAVRKTARWMGFPVPRVGVALVPWAEAAVVLAAAYLVVGPLAGLVGSLEGRMVPSPGFAEALVPLELAALLSPGLPVCQKWGNTGVVWVILIPLILLMPVEAAVFIGRFKDFLTGPWVWVLGLLGLVTAAGSFAATLVLARRMEFP